MKNFFKKIHAWLTKNDHIRIILILIVLLTLALQYTSIARFIKNADYPFKDYLDLRDKRYSIREISKIESRVDIEDIKPWMTIDYLSFVFGLPPNYLKDQLNIKDAKYLKLSIDKYAELTKADPADVLSKIKYAITNQTR